MLLSLYLVMCEGHEAPKADKETHYPHDSDRDSKEQRGNNDGKDPSNTIEGGMMYHRDSCQNIG